MARVLLDDGVGASVAVDCYGAGSPDIKYGVYKFFLVETSLLDNVSFYLSFGFHNLYQGVLIKSLVPMDIERTMM